MRALLSLALAAPVLFAAAPNAVQAQGQKPKDEKPAVSVTVTASFSDAERKIIAAYFTEHRYEAERLPPGIARNLARGKPLPPGIAKKQPPAALRAQLPKRDGFEVTIFGDRIVLLEASGLVVDILDGIFR